MEMLMAVPKDYAFAAKIFVSYDNFNGEDSRPYELDRIACILSRYFRVPLDSPETGVIGYHLDVTVVGYPNEQNSNVDYPKFGNETRPMSIINFMQKIADCEDDFYDAFIFIHDGKLWLCDTECGDSTNDIVLLDYNSYVEREYSRKWTSDGHYHYGDENFITKDVVFSQKKYVCEMIKNPNLAEVTNYV